MPLFWLALRNPAVVGLEGLLSKSIRKTPSSWMAFGYVADKSTRGSYPEVSDLKRKYESRQADLEGLIPLPSETGDGREIRLWATSGVLSSLSMHFILEPTVSDCSGPKCPFCSGDDFSLKMNNFSVSKDCLSGRRQRGDYPHPRFRGRQVLRRWEEPKRKEPILRLSVNPDLLAEEESFQTATPCHYESKCPWPCQDSFSNDLDHRRGEANQRVLELTKRELRKEGIPFDEGIPLGVMIEVPSAAILADQLVREG